MKIIIKNQSKIIKAGSIFLIKCTKEVEKLTSLKNIKYKSSDFWIFKKEYKNLEDKRLYNNIRLRFSMESNNKSKIGNDVRGDVVLIKINKTENIVKFREIEATENGIKLRGEL